VNLNILPLKLLADKLDARLIQHLKTLFPNLRQHFILEEGIHTERRNLGKLVHFSWGEIGLGANGRIRPMHQPSNLPGKFFLPR
jgi:hypothetical protein